MKEVLSITSTVESDTPTPKPIDLCKICVIGLAAYFGAPEIVGVLV